MQAVKCGPAQGKAFGIIADLTNPEDWQRAVSEAVAHMGGLNVLFNNGPPVSTDMREQVR